MRTCFAVVVAVQWRIGTFSVYATWAGDFVIQTKIFTDNEKETHWKFISECSRTNSSLSHNNDLQVPEVATDVIETFR